MHLLLCISTNRTVILWLLVIQEKNLSGFECNGSTVRRDQSPHLHLQVPPPSPGARKMHSFWLHNRDCQSTNDPALPSPPLLPSALSLLYWSRWLQDINQRLHRSPHTKVNTPNAYAHGCCHGAPQSGYAVPDWRQWQSPGWQFLGQMWGCKQRRQAI